MGVMMIELASWGAGELGKEKKGVRDAGVLFLSAFLASSHGACANERFCGARVTLP
jgi:hypothetical protein